MQGVFFPGASHFSNASLEVPLGRKAQELKSSLSEAQRSPGARIAAGGWPLCERVLLWLERGCPEV